MPNQPWRDTRDSAAGNARAGRQPDSAADMWALGTALGRAQAAAARGTGLTPAQAAEQRRFFTIEVDDLAPGMCSHGNDPTACGDCEVAMCVENPRTPLGRRHGYDLARLAWDDARRTCVECGADCGVSVDHCGRCGYPVCRQCGPFQMDDAGDVTVTCAQCRETGSL